MRITVKVKPGSKSPGLFIGDGGEYTARVSSFPLGGKANKELIDMMSKYFKAPKGNVKIISGFRSRNKIVEIDER